MHECKICTAQFELGKRLSDHIKKDHGLNSEEYTVKCYYNGVKPKCKICGEDTRYVSFSYKEYCKEHAKIAMKEGGKIGGAAEAWNRGKTADEDPRILRLFGEHNHFFGKKHTDKTREQISQTKRLDFHEVKSRIDKRFEEFELVDFNEYESRQQQYLNFKCKKCGTVNEKTLQSFERGSLCSKCFPSGKSAWELEVFNWVSQYAAAESGDREILDRKEIDILIRDKNFGIECHGLYWHSEEAGKKKDSDTQKILLAQQKGISLFIVYQDEWQKRRNIVQSMILHRLGLSKKLSARNLRVLQIDKASAENFLEEHHLDGSTSCTVAFGLFDAADELVSVMTFRKPFTKKWSEYIEIARFATRSGVTVRGGMSKLVAAAQKAFSGQARGIFTYSDNKIGVGNSYSAAGFEHAGETGYSYFYTDGEMKIGRFAIRAKGGKSEAQIASELGLYKVWGPGSKRWIMEFK